MARQGLFANTMGTEAAQRRAELAKERQAYLEGNIYSDPLVNIAAQAQRGMRQAFRDIGQGAATSMLGDQAYVDPILKDALKRDKDRKELMDMFANADTDGDGNVSEAEYKAVANAMKARGYFTEAEKVLDEMRKDVQLDLAKKKAGKVSNEWSFGTTRVITDSQNNKFYAVQGRPKNSADPAKDTKTLYSPIGHSGAAPVGEVKVTNDAYAQTALDRLNDKIAAIQGKGEEDRKTAKYGSDLRKDEKLYAEELSRETAKIKSKINIDEETAKSFAKKNLNTSEEFLRAGMMAVEERKKAKRLLELSQNLKTGGIAASLSALKREFGYEASDEAEFRTGAQMLLVQNLKRIMGARPTDTDLQQLALAMANIENTPEANIAILERFIKQMDKEIKYGKWFSDNPDKKYTDFYSEQMRPPPPEAAIELLKKNKGNSKFINAFRDKYGKKALNKALGK